MAKPKSNRVRIIGGAWRSRLFPFPDVIGLRPTPDRVRETLFNWMGQIMDGKVCLDLFAGSGAMGFEALSRGAARVVMVELDGRAARALRENVKLLGADHCELVVGDALGFLGRDDGLYDVIFVDPPYAQKLLPGILPGLSSRLKSGGVVYVESDSPQEFGPEWEVWRNGKAGQVLFYLLKVVKKC